MDAVVKIIEDISQAPGDCLPFQLEVGGQVARLDGEIIGEHRPSFYLLWVRQPTVDLGHQAVNALLNVRVQVLILDPQQGDAVWFFLTDQHGFSHAGDLAQARFHFCGLDIFPIGGFEQFFLASFKNQAAFGCERTQVAGCQPALL